MNEQSNADLLHRARRRAEGRPYFLAGALAVYQELHDMDDEAIARFLDCPAEVLPQLSLCRRPDPAAPDFRAAVEQIAAYLGVAPFSLARLLRDVATSESLRAAPVDAPSGGMLLAARDHEIVPTDAAPTGGPDTGDERTGKEPPADDPTATEER